MIRKLEWWSKWNWNDFVFPHEFSHPLVYSNAVDDERRIGVILNFSQGCPPPHYTQSISRHEKRVCGSGDFQFFSSLPLGAFLQLFLNLFFFDFNFSQEFFISHCGRNFIFFAKISGRIIIWLPSRQLFNFIDNCCFSPGELYLLRRRLHFKEAECKSRN